MPIRALGFDVDGTLYPASDVYLRLFAQGLARARTLAVFSRVRKEFRRLNHSPEYRALGIRSVEGFHKYQAGLVAEALGITEAEASERIEGFFYGVSTEIFAKIRPYGGVVEALSAFKTRGLALGALSDFPCGRKLELMGLSGLFDASMTSEETGLVKPDRASFELLAARLGVQPSEILYVGNSESYDVAGALASGMRAALITKKPKPRTAAEFSFFKWADLVAYVSKISA